MSEIQNIKENVHLTFEKWYLNDPYLFRDIEQVEHIKNLYLKQLEVECGITEKTHEIRSPLYNHSCNSSSKTKR